MEKQDMLLILLGWCFFSLPIKLVESCCGDKCNTDNFKMYCKYDLQPGVGACCEHLYTPGYTGTGGSKTQAKPDLQQFCDELDRDDDLAWTRPFTGFFPDGDAVPRRDWPKVCNTGPANWNNPQLYQMAPVQRFIHDHSPDPGSLADYTNRLRFTHEVIAQEGLSFCIVGSHYRKSIFSLWEPLKGFLPLAEKSFDIGNHIDPFNPEKMNTFKRPNSDALRKVTYKDCGGYCPPTIKAPWDAASVPTHRFEHVWLGVKRTNEEVSKNYGVPLHGGYEKRPAHPEWQPDENCQNPYKVEVTLIEADSMYLHNYLHIKVFTRDIIQPSGKNCPTGRIKLLMLEVRDQDGLPIGQFTDDVTCDQDDNTANEQLSCTNKATTECRVHYGSKMNHVPCMFSHPKAAVHPTIFMFSADKFTPGGGGSSPPSPGPGGPTGTAQHDACRNSQIPQSQRKPSNVQYKENPDQYVTEVHTTWRYAQMDHGWVSELHFATMIIEDETPIQYYTSRLTHWDGLWEPKLCAQVGYWVGAGNYYYCDNRHCCYHLDVDTEKNYRAGAIQLGLMNSCVNESYNTNRPYGYSAAYKVLKPTFLTKGGWDFFRKEFISPKDVNCHVSVTSAPEYYSEQPNGQLPIRKTLKDFLIDKYTLIENPDKYQPPRGAYRRWSGMTQSGFIDYPNTFELPDWHNPGMTKSTDGKTRIHAYNGKTTKTPILKMFDSAHQDPAVLRTEFDDKPFREYFGSRYIVPENDKVHRDVQTLQQKQDSHDHEFTMKEMAEDPKTRCPCPFFPTTPPPELATKPPVEIEGRRTHVVNMLLAWVILVPFSYFVARFYKESYSRVFFLQEFWWYTMHVLCLLTAILFTFGGIYGLKMKRTLGDPYEIVWTDATASHIYMGYTVIGLFIVHLLFGAFRFYDMELRVIQIGLHWLFGWLEYLCAVGCILSAAAIPSGIMNCVTFGIYCAFIVYQLVFTLGMEYHLHKVDEELDLNPPRAYFPPPMMRLFHRDAPHAKFRVVMLVVYAVGCFLFYVAMHISIKMEGAEFSCFQPTAEDIAEEVTG